MFYYNVHNLLLIRSVQRLPELKYFRTENLPSTPDIDVRIDADPAAYKTASSISYDEILGRFGFSIVINRRANATDVIASPLIKRSPHVLYTNVVEPLLRWALVRKGYALMHGACLAFGDKALFITAQTDTGKTTTILHTLRHNLRSCRFLSDDMTIFAEGGVVYNFPKPLTVSQHTLQAVGGADLSWLERIFLRVQSRLHSREGRRAGMWLSKIRMPAATMSAVVQWLIPPPKFMVTKLVPGAQLTEQSRLEQIVLIERGLKAERELADAEKVDILIANAEDAYGFPPYPFIADQLSHWEGEDLHEEEKRLVLGAIQGVPGILIRRDDYGWYERLPQLIQAEFGGTDVDVQRAATPTHTFHTSAPTATD